MLSAHSVRFWFWSSKRGPRLHRASSSAKSFLASLGIVMIVSHCTSPPSAGSTPDIRSDASSSYLPGAVTTPPSPSQESKLRDY
jgi:hypothetical protein